MKQFLSFNDQESCYQCLCEFFNIFRCFRFENWNDNSVSINSIFIDKIDSPDSKIDNYRLLTTKSFIDFYRISKKLIDFYRLLSNAIDYRYYRLTTSGIRRTAVTELFRILKMTLRVIFSILNNLSLRRNIKLNIRKFTRANKPLFWQK